MKHVYAVTKVRPVEAQIDRGTKDLLISVLFGINPLIVSLVSKFLAGLTPPPPAVR